MGLLQNPDPAIKLARQYGIRGIFTPELVPSIQPVVLIDDLTSGISNEPQRICTSEGTINGVAAETTVFRFETPPNVIALITHVIFDPETNNHINISFGSSVAAPATLFAGVLTDGRLRSQGQTPACILGADTYAAGVGNPTLFLASNVSNPVQIFQEVNWVVGRTDGFFDFVEFAMTTVDQNMKMALQWTEFDAVEVR